MQVRLLFRALVIAIAAVSGVAQPLSRLPQPLVATSTARERADFFLKQGSDDSAIAYYRLWTSANPRDTIAWLQLSKLLAKRGDIERALDALQGASIAGLSNREQILSDTLFAKIIRTGRGRAILERIDANSREYAAYPLRYARQERIGRYRVLFPPGYDSTQRYHLVLLLHGNGNEPIMMLRWARALGLERAIIVCPEAPYVKVAETIAQGRMRLSAAGEDLTAPDSLNPIIVELSARWYLTVVDDAERTLPIIRASLPIVVGFSQGGFYAQVLISRYPERFRAAVLLATSYYWWGGIAERLDLIRRYGIEILHVHGKADTIVPIQTAWLLREMYHKAGINYTLEEFEGEHWIPDDLARRIGRWIEEHFR
ncbi:MAG: alpha/beta hydrolase-fold protein [Candidatus Kapabacteria bacterium]|nr:alpha/beta hydrolase-fold protein [Candidatus Kapabacteria bacterium]